MGRSNVLLVAVMTVITCANISDKISYKGFKGIRIIPQNAQQVKILKLLDLEEGVDFWVRPNESVPTTAIVAPAFLKRFRQKLQENHIPFNITMNDVGLIFEEEQELQKIASNLIKNNKLTSTRQHLIKYLRYNEMVSMLNNIASRHRKICSLEEIGKTFEQRPMYMLKMSSNFTGRKPIALIESGAHAREWISPAMSLHMITQILKHPSLLDKQDWYFVPCANPDGYEYAHTMDRLWRKTRSYLPNVSEECVGTDLNRNYNIYWGKVGTSSNPCDDIYHGNKPFSEVESRNMRDVVHKYHKRIKTYIAVHAFGGFILYPWGFTADRAENWKQMRACGRKAAEQIKMANGPSFLVGSPSELLYPSAGASDDFFKATYKIPYAFTVELQRGGKSGFDPPPSKIRQLLQEAFPGMITLAMCNA